MTGIAPAGHGRLRRRVQSPSPLLIVWRHRHRWLTLPEAGLDFVPELNAPVIAALAQSADVSGFGVALIVDTNDQQHTGLQLDLTREADELQRGVAGNTGRAAKTLVRHDDLRIVLMAMRADAHLPLHQTSSSISIQTIRGRIRVQAGGQTYVLALGGALVLARDVPHEVNALEDSVFVLTIGSGAKG